MSGEPEDETDGGRAPDDWVLLRTFDDPALARMTLDFLRDHDIPVQTRGDSPEGVRNLYSPFDIRIVVPASRLEEAREALSAFTAEPLPETPFRGPLPPDELATEDDAPAAALRNKRGAFAFVLAFLVPIGGGHFYAQHGAAGLVIALSFVAFTIGAMKGIAALGIAAAAIVVLDALVAMFVAVGACNARRIPSAAVQRLRALAMAAAALALGFVSELWPGLRSPDHSLLERCENHDALACGDVARWYKTNLPEDRATIKRYEERACWLGDPKSCLSVP